MGRSDRAMLFRSTAGLLVWSAVSMGAAGIRGQNPPVSGDVLRRAASDAGRDLELIVTFDSSPGLFERSQIERLGGHVGRRLASIDALAIRLPAGAVARLAEEVNVAWITADASVEAGTTGNRPVAAISPAAPQPTERLGEGIAVAVVGAAIDPHPDLGHRLVARVDVTGRGSGGDPSGLATRLAGLIAGDGYRADGTLRGLAPSSMLVSLEVLGPRGRGRLSDVIAAVEWSVAHRSRLGIRVLTLAIDGVAVSEQVQLDPLTRSLANARRHGLVVVGCTDGRPTSSSTTTVVVAGQGAATLSTDSVGRGAAVALLSGAVAAVSGDPGDQDPDPDPESLRALIFDRTSGRVDFRLLAAARSTGP